MLSPPLRAHANPHPNTLLPSPPQIHRTLTKEFKYALVWGTSSKHYPQRCGLTHPLEDEDVVQVGVGEVGGKEVGEKPVELKGRS